ncbi:MAG TPA: helix-hairpin-helix domain-containing protein, partial [Terriglobales bacterium]|nr:helix-hairpin-helix domain-containing protein [Terriglobales bacterium]
NSAPANILTQLPGIGINVAYNIVNHRARHGFFTAFEELAEVKEFPMEKLNQIRERAVLIQPPEDRPGETVPPPRHLQQKITRDKKRTEGYTKSIRNTRRPERLNESHDQRHSGEDKKIA